jgi:uncharacterized protein YbbC (DUF1343 family)
MANVLTGLDCIREGAWKRLKGHRLGLLANQASVDSNFETARSLFARLLPGQLTALFGAQHGYGGEDQDNMIETPHSRDKELKIPIYSLYADTREPQPTMFEDVDILIIDLQDVGTRVYTFNSTMLNCLKAASALGRKVVVLDRPNPLGGEELEGNLLRPELYSFVGSYSLPMRHGLTMGEMAVMYNAVFELGCELEIATMQGWQRHMLWSDTGLTWIMPSPNMPIPETAYVYPGQVIWEGTNISEGRGTCRPFEIFGAPFLNEMQIERTVADDLHGCLLQPYTFRPTFHKWKGELCHGFMLRIIDHAAYRPYVVTLALLKTIMEMHRGDFAWKAPPYEYEQTKRPIDLILGDSSVRKELEEGVDISNLEEKWSAELDEFAEWSRSYHLYA